MPRSVGNGHIGRVVTKIPAGTRGSETYGAKSVDFAAEKTSDDGEKPLTFN